MRREKIFLRFWDLVILTLALFLVGFSAFRVYAVGRDARRVLVQSRDGQWIFPLDAEEKLDVSGPLGITVVRIQNHRAWVESSPCVNQLCVAQGHIQRGGVWLACLPNNIFIILESMHEDYIDAITW